MEVEKDWVSCSEIAQACYCPHAFELQSAGYLRSAAAQRQMEVGRQEHIKLNQYVQTGVKDKRCFVATHLYGAEDVRTQHLRVFREVYLKPKLWGRALIATYYFMSPYWVSICRRLSLADRMTRYGVDRLYRSFISDKADAVLDQIITVHDRYQ